MAKNIHWGGSLSWDCIEGVKILPNEIFRKLFSYLDLDSLKCARQVCQIWNTNIVPLLKEGSTCTVKPSYSQNCLNFITTMKNSAELPFKKFGISIKSGSRLPKIREIFSLFGHSIKTLQLTFECCGLNGNYKCSLSFEDLNFILQNLPNLNSFDIEAEYNSIPQKDFIVKDFGVEYNNIKVLTLKEAYQENLNTDFCISKELLPMFAKSMPNVEKIVFVFMHQDHVDQCISQLVKIRKHGLLKSVIALQLTVQSYNTVYFDQGHLSSLSDLKLPFEYFELQNFYFFGCDTINREDISPGAMYNFLSKISNSLKVLWIHNMSGRRVEVEAETSNIPVMKNLRALELDLGSTIGLMPISDWAYHFPRLCDFFLHSDWNTLLNELFPNLAHNTTTLLLKIPGGGKTKEEPDRFIEFRHEAHDYLFMDPDFFNLYFTSWFPIIKVIRSSLNVHFGLHNLLRGLSNTNVEEIHVEVDCEICKNGESFSPEEKLIQDEYIASHQYDLEQDLRNTPFPRLRSLLIVTDCCTKIFPQYLETSDVMNLLKAAPYLDSFEIRNDHPDYLSYAEISTMNEEPCKEGGNVF